LRNKYPEIRRKNPGFLPIFGFLPARAPGFSDFFNHPHAIQFFKPFLPAQVTLLSRLKGLI